jgi:hypothetical protein
MDAALPLCIADFVKYDYRSKDPPFSGKMSNMMEEKCYYIKGIKIVKFDSLLQMILFVQLCSQLVE